MEREEYGKAKIGVERMWRQYCEAEGIDLINLRLGAVSKNDRLHEDKPLNRQIHLYHRDLKKIIDKAINMKGRNSYICVSEGNLFDESLRFPFKEQ